MRVIYIEKIGDQSWLSIFVVYCFILYVIICYSLEELYLLGEDIVY